jgi:hypothetical protein
MDTKPKYLTPKYLTPKAAALIYGVHPDFFRKQPELRKHRIVINRRTHLYPVRVLDLFFRGRAPKRALRAA